MKKSSFFKRFTIGSSWLWLGAFAILPNIALLVVALLDRSSLGFFIPLLTLKNFAALFDPVFVKVLVDSFVLAFLATVMCLFMGYPFAYLLAKADAKKRPWLLFLVIIPFWTNSLIRTYALILMLGAQGMVNKFLMMLGIISTPINMMYTPFAVFVGLSYTLLPFMVLPLFASIEKLDPKLLDAARDLGAGTFRTFWHITLPLTLPGIVAGCILVFLPSLGIFYVPEILGGATNLLLGTFIKNQFLVANNWPLGAASSMVMTLMLGLLALIYRLAGKRAGAKHSEGILGGGLPREDA